MSCIQNPSNISAVSDFSGSRVTVMFMVTAVDRVPNMGHQNNLSAISILCIESTLPVLELSRIYTGSEYERISLSECKRASS